MKNHNTKTTIIAIANQKGGVAKTMTAVNVAAWLQVRGKKVLCLDFDPQCDMSEYLGYDLDWDEVGTPTITDYVIAVASYKTLPPVNGVIRKSKTGIDYIPASLELSKADQLFAMAFRKEEVLAEALCKIIQPNVYDYVIIDCNPSMGILLTNALAASDKVIVPVQTKKFSLRGLQDMIEQVRIVKGRINPELELLGFIPTLQTHTQKSRNVVNVLHDNFGDLTFSNGTYVYNKAADDSVEASLPLTHLPDCKLKTQYMNITDELLERLEG